MQNGLHLYVACDANNFCAALMTITVQLTGKNYFCDVCARSSFLPFTNSQDQLDKLGVALRNACRDDELDLVNQHNEIFRKVLKKSFR